MINTLSHIDTCRKPNSKEDLGHLEYQNDKKTSFKIENKWEGIVQEINGNTIYTLLTDVENGAKDEFVFEKQKISNDDLELLEEGALFDFFLGFSINKGARENAHKIKFRRKKIIDNEKINEIFDQINELDFNSLIESY